MKQDANAVTLEYVNRWGDHHTLALYRDSYAMGGGFAISALDATDPADNGFAAPDDCKTFAGWNTAEDGSGTVYKPGDTLPSLTDDITLYAQWDDTGCEAEGLAQTGISTTTTIFAAVLFTFVSTILAAFSRLLRRRS